MTSTATLPNAPLDPNLLNLHHLLNQHLGGIAPLIADLVNVSVGQARLLCTHAIDVSLIFLLKNQNELYTPSNAILKKRHALLHASPLNLQSLSQLELVNCEQLFLDKSDEVIKRLSLLTKVVPQVAKHTASLICTLCQQHIALLATDGRLTDSQKSEWLGLQPIFLQKHGPAQFWSALAQHTLETPSVSTKASQFDDRTHTLPNHAWLPAFAERIKIRHQKPLAIGRILHPNDTAFDAPVQTATPAQTPATLAPIAPIDPPKEKSQNNFFAWLVSGAVMATAVGVFAVPKLFNDKPETPTAIAVAPQPKPAKPNTQAQSLGHHQDIAVVRIKDDEPEAEGDLITLKPKTQDRQENKTNQGKVAPADSKEKSRKADPVLVQDSKAKKERDNKEKEREKARERDKAKVAQLAKKSEPARLDKTSKASDKKAELAKQPAKPKAETLVKSPKPADKATPKTEKSVKAEKPVKTSNPVQTNKPVKTEKPKADPKPKPNNEVAVAPKPSSDLYTTIHIEQTTAPTERVQSDDRPKNKNKNNAEPIINQDTIGKLGGQE